VRDAAFGQHLL